MSRTSLRIASFKSLRQNFVLPSIAFVATAIILMFFGVRPWQDEGAFYSLVCYSLGALVITAVGSEFLRGAAVIQRHTGQIFASMLQLTRRNTRRYGGYIVHFGIVVMFIGFAGAAFNQSITKRLKLATA